MKRILAAFGVAGLALLGATAPATASPSEDEKKITICHATGSESNPYVPVTISLNALNAHVGHQHDEDIIPANDGKVLPGGQNLDKAGIWNAGCAAPGEPNGNGHGDHKITICHATGSDKNPYVPITIALQGLNGHANANHQHTEDIIPPNTGKVLPAGQNWTAKGQATYNNGCVPTSVPTVVPPGETPRGAVVGTPGETPRGAVVGTPGETPRGAVVGAPAGQGAVAANNPGFNVQTAVAGSTDVSIAPWAAGIVVMLLAAAGVAARRTLAASGTVSRPRKE
ncbi:hypothetical protein [Pseudarthrobacter cellobiosi]|uniref:hypothetical protein n=1 Tax=Pseudarthrobacter cellobiosi TaxID=2953654 RepID=UPI00208E1E6A|nr:MULTISPECIES: hypothetical protein [unclassified Pseudarthrobacter]MCO4257197.1 hypothetical protein [Pseudarthrobacter sp. HLT1-5]MCO4274361.1 hypothetical protein [Pseudarthrobacter sp. HLT3-5]